MDRSLTRHPDMSFALLSEECFMFQLPVFAHNSLPFTVEQLEM